MINPRVGTARTVNATCRIKRTHNYKTISHSSEHKNAAEP